jgi:hypothetical protein
MRDQFELAVSRLGKTLGNWNDSVHGRAYPEGINSGLWRFVDRIAARLYTYGER